MLTLVGAMLESSVVTHPGRKRFRADLCQSSEQFEVRDFMAVGRRDPGEHVELVEAISPTTTGLRSSLIAFFPGTQQKSP
jgi:hypothetical protein